MTKALAAALVAAMLTTPAWTKGALSIYSTTTLGNHTSPIIARGSHGYIARSSHAKEEFRRAHPCPVTGKKYGACPGWVVDHVQALKRGGADDASNMQWQTHAEAKAKDRWE
jgi:hypothetical protein